MIIFTVLVIIINLVFMTCIIGPLLLLIYLPLLIYRESVNLLSKMFRRDIVTIARTRDSVFANDDLTNPDCTILLMVKFAGDMTLEHFTGHLAQCIFKEGKVKKEYCKFEEILQYFVPWGGFMFRKWEDNFDIRNHAREWKKRDESPFTTEDLYELRRKLLKDPFRPLISPWEFIIIRNVAKEVGGIKGTDQETTLVIGRFHHGILDGFSLSQVLINQFSSMKTIGLVQLKPLTFLQNVAVVCATFATAPSEAIGQIPKIHPTNIFHPRNTKLTGKRHPVNCFLPVQLVKQISKQTETSFTAVLLAALAGGIRNYLKVKGNPIPESMDLSIPLPWPGHPDQIGNHFTFVVLSIPTGLATGSERLKSVQKAFLKLKRSTSPALNFASAGVAGTLPLGLMNAVLKGAPSSILMSNLPGPTTPSCIFERNIIETLFEGGYSKSELGMGVTMLSYNGVLTISINPDEGIIPTKTDANILLRSIANEFDLLNSDSIV